MDGIDFFDFLDSNRFFIGFFCGAVLMSFLILFVDKMCTHEKVDENNKKDKM